MRPARSLQATLALLTLAASGLAGCTASRPTNGYFACANGRCPAEYPFCHPSDLRCYSTPEEDAGPRPDAALDAAGAPTIYGVCAVGPNACGVPGVDCFRPEPPDGGDPFWLGRCFTNCSTGASDCQASERCVPAPNGIGSMCVPSCDVTSCPDGFTCRDSVVCFPSDWP